LPDKKGVLATSDGFEKFNRISPLTNTAFNFVFVILALFAVVPVLFVFSIAFSKESAIQEFGYRLIPMQWSLDGFTYLLRQRTMITRALGMSILVTVVGTAIGVLLTALMGYVISRKEYKLQKLMTWIVFIPMIFNGGLVATYVVNTQMLKLKDTIWAMILPLCVSSFNVILCKTFFRLTIPDSILESVRIDGGGQLTAFFRIVLPLSLPVLATVALFLCFAYWNDWWQAMLYIDNQKLYTLQAFLNKLMSDITMLAKNAEQMGASQLALLANLPKESARMAVVVVIVLPIACAYPFFQRYFISGLTIGSVKG
jgi:putative aldouronate transport system permease protein